MHHIICMCVLLLYLTVIKFANASSVGVNKLFEKYHTDNYKVPNTFNSVKTRSLLNCCDLCVLSNNCNAVNYDQSDTVCELIQTSGTDASTLLLEVGWRIYYIKVDECFSSPCLHSATCVDTEFSYTCQCNVGWQGNHCESNADECASNPCINGGTCTDDVNHYTCTCIAGYIGVNCETDIDECASSPCLNGGTCTDYVNQYICTCVAGYYGLYCETDINECSSNPCASGATCMDLVDHYTCSCTPSFTGVNCYIPLNTDECASNPCINGGTCTDDVNHYTCTCLAGYVGVNCETDIDECASSPCLNGGTCTDYVNQYICTCVAGYYGLYCETDINECSSNPCASGATCIDLVDHYTCACTSMFTGVNCYIPLSTSCSSSWVGFGGSCYHLAPQERSWYYAKMTCEGHGGHLVDIKTEAEMNFLKTLYQANFAVSDLDHQMWTGGNDIVTSGVRLWSDGTKMADFWSDMDPLTEVIQECVWFDPARNYIWYDGPCSDEEYYICEKP